MKNYIIASIVFREVKAEYGITAAQMNSSTRVAKVREARQIFTQLMREHSSMTLEEIGMLVNRDHSTISITSKVVRSELDTNVGYRKRYLRVKNNIKNQIEDGKELC
jgi:chromosomal replication initiation ATPase DnaA